MSNHRGLVLDNLYEGLWHKDFMVQSRHHIRPVCGIKAVCGGASGYKGVQLWYQLVWFLQKLASIRNIKNTIHSTWEVLWLKYCPVAPNLGLRIFACLGKCSKCSMRGWQHKLQRVNKLRDVVQSFGKIRYLVSVQDRGREGVRGYFWEN